MDIFELLQAATLKDVRTIERSAVLKLGEKGLAALGEIEPAGDMALDLNLVSWGSRIEVWFRVDLQSPQLQVRAAVAVVYERGSDEEIPEDVRVEFLEKVAIMAAYPYLRAEVQELAAGLRAGNVTLGVLRQGEFRVEPRVEAAPLVDETPVADSPI